MTKKRINSAAKGKRGENQACELLRQWWDDPEFIRNSIGSSGAIATQMAGNKNLPSYILEAITSDIITPQEVKMTFEIKSYAKLDLFSVIRNDNSLLHQFWRQAFSDAERCGNLIPLVMMKEDHKQFYCMYDPNNMPLGSIPYLYLTFQCDENEIHIASWKDWSEHYTKEIMQQHFKEKLNDTK